MKNLFIWTTIMLCLLSKVQGQVNWSFETKKVSDKVYEIHLKGTVGEGWHIYSQTTPEGGPLPTKIVFGKNPLAALTGAARENGEMEIYYDENFKVDVYAFRDSVDFVQTIKLKVNAKTTISGSIHFMVCNDNRCMPPDKKEFSLKLE